MIGRLLPPAALVAALVLLGSATAHARPPAGAKYEGKTSQGRVIKLRISASGTGLQMDFRERFTCTGTPSKVLFAHYVRQRPTVRKDGSFAYKKSYSGLSDPAFPGRFSERQDISGSFTGDNRTVRGRSTSRIRGEGYTCRAAITFTARRVP